MVDDANEIVEAHALGVQVPSRPWLPCSAVAIPTSCRLSAMRHDPVMSVTYRRLPTEHQGRRTACQVVPGLAWLVATLVALPALASAQETACNSSASQADLNDCAALAWQVADERLNEAYDWALVWARDADALDAEGGTEARLRAAQRAWLAYRDANCQVNPEASGQGQMAPMLLYGCMEAMTTMRADELLALAQGVVP